MVSLRSTHPTIPATRFRTRRDPDLVVADRQRRRDAGTTLPMPGSCTMLVLSPSSMQRCDTRVLRALRPACLLKRSRTISMPCISPGHARHRCTRSGSGARAARPSAARPPLARPLDQPVAQDDLDDLEPDRCRHRVRRHASCRTGSRARDSASSISADAMTAASGRPAPSVFDRVRMSGTAPSRSKANIAPVRPRPVCALRRRSAACRARGTAPSARRGSPPADRSARRS